MLHLELNPMGHHGVCIFVSVYTVLQGKVTIPKVLGDIVLLYDACYEGRRFSINCNQSVAWQQLMPAKSALTVHQCKLVLAQRIALVACYSASTVSSCASAASSSIAAASSVPLVSSEHSNHFD